MKKDIVKYQLNELGDELISIIRNRTNIFTPLTIVVPSDKIEKWFKAYWLKNNNDVLMNIRFMNIDNALLSLINTNKSYSLLNKNEIKTLIIKFLLTENLINYPDAIDKYIHNNDNTINHIKVYDLADKLSSLYIQYEQDLVEITDWQKELYNLVLNEASIYIFNKEQNLKVNNSPIYFLGFIKFTKLQERIIEEYSHYSEIYLLLLEKHNEYDKEFNITSAPSKLREVEYVHSKICKLLQDPNIKYGDILVLAPNISKYENIIHRVFNQDNINFPNIPFVINNKKRIETNVSSGLKKLFEILNKKFYTRLDFLNIIGNKDVQKSRNILLTDIPNWAKSIINMNVYRNSFTFDDWEYAKNRVLLSKVSNINDIDDNIIELNGKDYIPYSSIEFDDESIIKFVSLIDDLNSWLNVIGKIEYINKENLNIIKEELNKWFSIKDNNEFETNSYYKNIIKNIEFLQTINIPDNLIPINTLFYMLIDSSLETKFRSGEYFTRGITFTDFDDSSILSAKYIFFLNANSSELPKRIYKSELDLREYDIVNIEKQEELFFIQYQNALECFYVSYVNKNLKTDEDFYPSTFVLNLKNNSTFNEEYISLDETRSWSELFTKKEYKDKNYYLGLLSNKEIVEEKDEKYIFEHIKKVRLRLFSDYLEEPFKTKIGNLFGRDDSYEERFEEQFEPFDIDNLSMSILTKKICLDALVNKKSIDDVESFNNILYRFNIEHKLPIIGEIFNKIAFIDILDESKKLIELIENDTLGNYEIIKLSDLVFENDSIQWVLTSDDEMCLSIDGLKRTYYQLKKLPKSDFYYDYLYTYVYSLMDVARLEDNTYIVVLSRNTKRSFAITPNEARDILVKIYNKLNDYDEMYCLPIDILFDDKIDSYSKYINSIKTESKSPWAYFVDRNLFDLDTELGLTEDNFDELYNVKRKEHLELIKVFDYIEGENNE